jgi:hypothetical protein
MHAGIRLSAGFFATWAMCLKSQGDTQPAWQKFNCSQELGILARVDETVASIKKEIVAAGAIFALHQARLCANPAHWK